MHAGQRNDSPKGKVDNGVKEGTQNAEKITNRICIRASDNRGRRRRRQRARLLKDKEQLTMDHEKNGLYLSSL